MREEAFPAAVIPINQTGRPPERPPEPFSEGLPTINQTLTLTFERDKGLPTTPEEIPEPKNFELLSGDNSIESLRRKKWTALPSSSTHNDSLDHHQKNLENVRTSRWSRNFLVKLLKEWRGNPPPQRPWSSSSVDFLEMPASEQGHVAILNI